jgi:thiamine monophosphate synthase
VGPVPKVVLNTVRVPLTAFGGVNLHNIRSVAFTFNEQAQGAVLVTDVAFASAPQ